MNTFTIERWTRSGRLAVGGAALVLLILALLPALASGLVIDKLTTLFIYILLAVMWNLLAGYAGLVSVGQQAFFGVGGYLALRLVDAGMPPYMALVVGAAGAGIVAIPISAFALRLKGGEFAIAMWVIAEVLRIVVMFDPLVQGETGTSLLALNAFDPGMRRNLTYWLGLGALSLMLAATFWLLRSKIGSAAQAIRDDEDAAASIGIDVMRIKQIIFVLAAFWLRFRPTGRALYAIGGNAEVARLSGLNVTRIKIGVYMIAGLLAAVAGVIVGSRLDSAQPTAGTADLLNVIAVVVIGGASLSGGSGGMLNTFIGLLIIGVLNNGMSLLNVSPNLQPVVIGVAIIVAVLTDRASRSRQGS